MSYYQVHFKTDEKYQQRNFYKKGFFWGEILKWATPLSSFEMLSQFYCFCCCFLAQNFNRLRIRSWWETYHIKPTSHVWKYQENRSDSIFGSLSVPDWRHAWSVKEKLNGLETKHFFSKRNICFRTEFCISFSKDGFAQI